MTTNRSLIVFILVGLLSGVICWAGGLWIPEDSFFVKPYPGIVLGLSLFGLGRFLGVFPRSRSALSVLALVAFSIVGWRLSIDVGYHYSKPLAFTAAGAIGALSVSLGLLLAWSVIKRRYLFVVIVTLGGAVGGLIFRFINELVSDSSGDLWAFFLFVEWQVIFLIGIWIAMNYGKSRGKG